MPTIFGIQHAVEQTLSENLAAHETLYIPLPSEQPATSNYASKNHFVSYDHYCLYLPGEDAEPELYASLNAAGDTFGRYWRVAGTATEASITMTHYQQDSRNHMRRYTRESDNPDRTFRALARLAKMLGTSSEVTEG